MVKRGEIWWASLPDPVGSAPGYHRPVVVVQANRFNRANIRTVLVAVITSSMAHAHTPGNVMLSAIESGLPKDSVVNLSQLTAIDRHDLENKIGELSQRTMEKISEALRLTLSL